MLDPELLRQKYLRAAVTATETENADSPVKPVDADSKSKPKEFRDYFRAELGAQDQQDPRGS